ncbi:MAG TPA: TonB-dependent receptor [Gemmatimonadales bacterium]|nr:TonB-dependent receptor [Gemmatimonadales bacterium]
MNRRLSLAVAVALVVPSALAGQEVVARDTLRLPELVTTGTRLPASAGGDVSSLGVLTEREIRDRTLRFVLDGLRDQPGAALVQGGGQGAQASLFLRGGNSDYVKVLVDGVPVNQPGGTFNFANLTTDNLERIEVLRGPASVLYGSDAMTGVVQLFTRRGAGRPRVSLGALGGSQGSSQFDASLRGGSSSVGYSASVGRVGSSGIYDVNNDYRNTVASGRLDLQPGAGTRLAFTGRFSDGRYEFPTDFTGAPVDSNQFNTERTVTLGLDATQRLSDRVEARVLLAANEGDATLEDAPDSPGDSTGFGYAGLQASATARRGADARLVVRPDAALTLTGGVAYEYEREDLESEYTSNFGGGAFTDRNAFDESRGTTTGYVQGVLQLASGLSGNAGVRFDDNSAFGGFTTWRLGAAWRLGSGTRLRASVGTAYKAPKFRELFIAVPFEVGNAALSPERSTTWEVGVEQPLAQDRVRLGLAYFDSRFRDLIQYSLVDFENPATPTYYNLGAADARGIEAEASWRPLAALELAAQYTWLSTEVVDAGASLSPVFEQGQPLVRRPEHSGRLRVNGRPHRRLGLGANVNLVGDRADVDFSALEATRVTLASYVLVEATADAELLAGAPGRPGVTALVRVENLLDEEYEAALGFPGRGRTVLAGARLQF